MKMLLIMAVTIVFISSCFNSAYESKPGVPKPSQYQ